MNNLYCGVDIAKDTAMFHLINQDGLRLGSENFANAVKGFKKAESWLRNLAKKFKPFHVHVCMEATGVYYLPLAKFFHGKTGITVLVANPAQVKSYAQAELVRTKTDSVDAGVIARFAMAVKPAPWTPPAPQEEEILYIVRHIDAIKEMRQAEENRLHALDASGADASEVHAAITNMIKFMDGQIDKLEQRLRDISKNDPDVGEKIRLLRSIPGVGETTAFNLLAELGDIGRFKNGKQVTAYAGLAPSEKTSGTSVRGKSTINKRGSSRLRKSLFFPALTAKKVNPVVKELFDRLVAAGKNRKLAVVACMRKLLHIAYGVLKNKKEFDAEHGKQIFA